MREVQTKLMGDVGGMFNNSINKKLTNHKKKKKQGLEPGFVQVSVESLVFKSRAGEMSRLERNNIYSARS